MEAQGRPIKPQDRAAKAPHNTATDNKERRQEYSVKLNPAQEGREIGCAATCFFNKRGTDAAACQAEIMSIAKEPQRSRRGTIIKTITVIIIKTIVETIPKMIQGSAQDKRC